MRSRHSWISARGALDLRGEDVDVEVVVLEIVEDRLEFAHRLRVAGAVRRLVSHERRSYC